MSDDEYLSDHASDIESYDGADDEENESLITPSDPNEGFDEDDDELEYEEDDADFNSEEEVDEDLEPEEEIIDLKSVSKYNKELIVVKPENMITSNVLTSYNMTEIVSIRATQIAKFNNCLVDVSDLTDPIKMAKRELMMRKCPLTLRRIVGEIKDPKTGELQSYVEFWDVNTMQFAVEYTDVWVYKKHNWRFDFLVFVFMAQA